MQGDHVGYCPGPAQLVYLLAAWRAARIPPSRCRVQIYRGLTFNTELDRDLAHVIRTLELQVFAPAEASPRRMPALLVQRVLRLPGPAYWFCRGAADSPYPYAYLQQAGARRVYEYYDGYRSPIVIRDIARRPPPPLRPRNLGKRLARRGMRRLLAADGYFMPDASVWREYAPPAVQARTTFVSPDEVRAEIHRVGGCLELPPLRQAPGVVLATGMFAEREPGCTLDAELRLYGDTLAAVRRARPDAQILVKSHPRTSPEKMQGLQALCERVGALLFCRQQLLEYILDRHAARDAAVIGPPTTALLNTVTFGHGRAACFGEALVRRYFGEAYDRVLHMRDDHELMRRGGVTELDGLPALAGWLKA